MASRNGSERGAVVAQSACPLFAVTAAPAVATILPLPPFSAVPGADGVNGTGPAHLPRPTRAQARRALAQKSRPSR